MHIQKIMAITWRLKKKFNLIQFGGFPFWLYNNWQLHMHGIIYGKKIGKKKRNGHIKLSMHVNCLSI